MDKITNSSKNTEIIPAVRQSVISAVENPVTPDILKIKDLLNQGAPVSIEVVKVLKEGLAAVKPVVMDGEMHMVTDFETRRKYVDTILDVIGEKKLFEGSAAFVLSIQDRENLSSRLNIMLGIFKK